MRTRDLERVARRVAQILGKGNCLLAGGLAVGAHGYVRATKDVDFVVKETLTEAQRRLKEHGIHTVLTHGDSRESDYSCIKGTLSGIRFDVIPSLVPLDWDRAIELPMSKKVTLRVVDLDGLIHLKLRARGPRDLMDVAALILRHREHRERARILAVAYGVADELEVWLHDPRLRAEIAEIKASERALGRPIQSAANQGTPR